MIGSIGRVFLRGLITIATVLPLIALTGCHEVFTYARQSRTEGLSLYKQKAYPEAAGAFRNATRQDPRDYESHFWLAQCYDQMELYQEAFAEYQAALEILPNTYGGKNDEEFRQQIMAGYAESIARFDKRDIELNALEKRAETTQRAQEPLIIAKVYRIRGDADLAILAYKRATNWSPSDFAIRKEFGLYLYDTLHQNRDGEYQLKLAYRLDANDKEVITALQKLGALPIPKLPSEQQDAVRPAAPERTVSAPRD